MLRSIQKLNGRVLGATDGEIGHVKDVYFDDRSRAVRYLVADTGSWLPGRKVLIPPRAFGELQLVGKLLTVHLTRKQIEDSPPIDSHKPVSRQYEEEYYRYHGWPFYWQGDVLWGMAGTQVPTPPEIAAAAVSDGPAISTPASADAHLRSAHAVHGYQIMAVDGTAGHVTDFVFDDKDWTIESIVVRTGHRLSGTEVRVPAAAITRISYENSTVYVTLTVQAVEKSPPHHIDPAGAVDLKLFSAMLRPPIRYQMPPNL
jgi:sporulation protein YlmC with PRC-barrel domain